MRPRNMSWEEFEQLPKVRGQQGKHLPLSGANDGPVPNETGNSVRNPRMAGNKGTAPVSLRGKSVESLHCAGRGEAYSPEAGQATPLRTKESERSTNAGARPAPSPKSPYAPYRNKLEFNFAQTLVIEKHAKLIKDWAYESMTLKLSTAAPGKRGDYHRSDFLIWHLDNSIEIAQTKGWHLNIAASLKGLRWAAQKNPWFRFTIRRYNNGWHTEEVKP